MSKSNGQAVAIDSNPIEIERDRAPGERVSGIFETEPASSDREPSKVVELDTSGRDPNQETMDESGVDEDFETYSLIELEYEPVGFPGNYQERIKCPAKLGWITSRPGRTIKDAFSTDGYALCKTRKQLRKWIEIVPDPCGLDAVKRCGSRHNNGRKRRGHRDVSRAERLLTDKAMQAERADENMSHLEWLMMTVDHHELNDEITQWDRDYARLQATSPLFEAMRAPTAHGWLNKRGDFLSDPHTEHQRELYTRTDDGRLPLVLLERPISDEELAEILMAQNVPWGEPVEPIVVEPHRVRKPSRCEKFVRRMPPVEFKGRKPLKPRHNASIMRTSDGFEIFPEGDRPDFGLES